MEPAGAGARGWAARRGGGRGECGGGVRVRRCPAGHGPAPAAAAIPALALAPKSSTAGRKAVVGGSSVWRPSGARNFLSGAGGVST